MCSTSRYKRLYIYIYIFPNVCKRHSGPIIKRGFPCRLCHCVNNDSDRNWGAQVPPHNPDVIIFFFHPARKREENSAIFHRREEDNLARFAQKTLSQPACSRRIVHLSEAPYVRGKVEREEGLFVSSFPRLRFDMYLLNLGNRLFDPYARNDAL